MLFGLIPEEHFLSLAMMPVRHNDAFQWRTENTRAFFPSPPVNHPSDSGGFLSVLRVFLKVSQFGTEWHPACNLCVKCPLVRNENCLRERNGVMHATQMAEIGGWLSICSEVFTRGGHPANANQAMRYWSASKCRLQRWQAALKVFENDFQNPCEMHDPWHAIEVVIQEILMSELLTRVWTVVLIQHDRYIEHNEMQSIGQSVFIGHLETRNRAMRLMIKNRASNQKAYDRLEELRRRMERWVDLLLSRISDLELAIQFGFDEHRVRDFAADRHMEDSQRRDQVQKLLLASLTSSLKNGVKQWTANPDLNREIAAGVLACFPGDRFDTHGIPKSIMMMQMDQVQNDTHAMVQGLIDEEDQINPELN